MGADKKDAIGKGVIIFEAIEVRSMENLDLLLKAGAGIEHRDKVGMTPLVRYAVMDWYAGIERLLIAGADYRVRWGHFDLARVTYESVERRIKDTGHANTK